VRAFVFDLGDTLVEYEGLPLSWVDYYPPALARLAAFLGADPDAAQIEGGCALLRGFNTRLHPRVDEVAFSRILAALCGSWSVPPPGDEAGAARAFFSVFRQRLRCFPDSRPALVALRAAGAKIGVFTDVPYGMPRSLVLEDIRESGLDGLLALVVTSGEVGQRKPAPATLASVAGQLGFGPGDLAHVGNERKDVTVAKVFGCRAILVDRTDSNPAWGQDETIASLMELLPGRSPTAPSRA
jgi:putative hydrolase of the HAD superfamily